MNLFLQQVLKIIFLGILLPPPRALQVLAGQGGWEVAPTLWDLEHLGDGQWDPGDDNTKEGHTIFKQNFNLFSIYKNSTILFVPIGPWDVPGLAPGQCPLPLRGWPAEATALLPRSSGYNPQTEGQKLCLYFKKIYFFRIISIELQQLYTFPFLYIWIKYTYFWYQVLSFDSLFEYKSNNVEKKMDWIGRCKQTLYTKCVQFYCFMQWGQFSSNPISTEMSEFQICNEQVTH